MSERDDFGKWYAEHFGCVVEWQERQFYNGMRACWHAAVERERARSDDQKDSGAQRETPEASPVAEVIAPSKSMPYAHIVKKLRAGQWLEPGTLLYAHPTERST